MKKIFLSVALSITIFLILLTGCSGDGPSGTISGGDWTPGQTSVKLLGGSWYSAVLKQRTKVPKPLMVLQ